MVRRLTAAKRSNPVEKKTTAAGKEKKTTETSMTTGPAARDYPFHATVGLRRWHQRANGREARGQFCFGASAEPTSESMMAAVLREGWAHDGEIVDDHGCVSEVRLSATAPLAATVAEEGPKSQTKSHAPLRTLRYGDLQRSLYSTARFDRIEWCPSVALSTALSAMAHRIAGVDLEAVWEPVPVAPMPELKGGLRWIAAVPHALDTTQLRIRDAPFVRRRLCTVGPEAVESAVIAAVPIPVFDGSHGRESTVTLELRVRWRAAIHRDVSEAMEAKLSAAAAGSRGQLSGGVIRHAVEEDASGLAAYVVSGAAEPPSSAAVVDNAEEADECPPAAPIGPPFVQGGADTS